MLEDEQFYNQMKENLNVSNDKNIGNNKILGDYLIFPKNEYKMTIVVRKDLKMSIGKIASQVAHGVLEAYKTAIKTHPDYVENWENYSGSAKIVLCVNSLKEIND